MSPVNAAGSPSGLLTPLGKYIDTQTIMYGYNAAGVYNGLPTPLGKCIDIQMIVRK